jgi:hypothetical protein
MELRRVLISEIEKVKNLELLVAAEVGADRYFPLTDYALRKAVSHGLVFGAFDAEQLVGICAGFVEQTDKETFKGKVRNWKEVLGHDGFLRFAYVMLSSQRGKGVTKDLLVGAMAAAAGAGFQHAIATVAVDNGPSIKILIDSGFQIQFVGPVYHDKIRLVTYHKFGSLTTAALPSEWALSTDVQSQQSLLARNYLGVAVRREGDATAIGYQSC